MFSLRHILICVCGLVATTVLLAAPADTSNVVNLDNRNFDSTVKNGESWFVEFYAPWCGHCKRLESTWEELANTQKGERWHEEYERLNITWDESTTPSFTVCATTSISVSIAERGGGEEGHCRPRW
jgi:hypothetical protein